MSKPRRPQRARPTRAPRKELKRIPPGSPQLKLSVTGTDDSKRQYWALPRQFDELKAGGYTFVKRKGVTIGTSKNGNTDLGSIVSHSAGGGSAENLYLMEIDKAMYEENEAFKQSYIDDVEDQINFPEETDTSYARDGSGQRLSSIRHA